MDKILINEYIIKQLETGTDYHNLAINVCNNFGLTLPNARDIIYENLKKHEQLRSRFDEFNRMRLEMKYDELYRAALAEGNIALAASINEKIVKLQGLYEQKAEIKGDFTININGVDA